MDPLVFLKGRLLNEAFPTLGALIRLLSRVGSVVDNQGGFLHKALPTHGTLVRLLSRVRPLVQDEAAPPAEAFATGSALVQLLSRVDPLVRGSFVSHEVVPVPKVLPAFGAFVRPLSCMNPLV